MANSSSSQKTQHSPVAVAYARSLLELANEQGQAEAIGSELRELQQITTETPGLRDMLSNPSLGLEERQKLLDSAFRNNVSPLIFNTLGIMSQHHRLALLGDMAAAYLDLLDVQLGKIEVDMTVAHPLSPEQQESARQRIGQALGREAIMRVDVNPDIIGGVIVRVGDKLIDASVKYQLAAMREQLLASAPRA